MIISDIITTGIYVFAYLQELAVPGVIIFFLWWYGYSRIKHRRPARRLWISVLIACLIIGAAGGLVVLKTRNVAQQAAQQQRYQNEQQDKAAALGFQLYEPRYTPSGYTFDENWVNDVHELEYFYTQDTPSPNSTASRDGYWVIVRSVNSNFEPSSQEGSIQAASRRGDVGVYVTGTVSRDEAAKVAQSMTAVETTQLQFRTVPSPSGLF